MGDFERAGRRIPAAVLAAVVAAALFFLLAAAPAKTAGTAAGAKPAAAAPSERDGAFVYGRSGLGQALLCYRVSPEKPGKARLLLTYEIHGFEDAAPRDGQFLVEIGNAVTQYFTADRSRLSGCTLYVVPSANPDGLRYGTTADGKGRCQISLGVDINRDFDYFFQPNAAAREHTLSAPFASPESRALRSLVQTVKPTAVVDTHGWDDEFIGDAGLAAPFRRWLDMPGARSSAFSQNQRGFFSAWAGTQNARSLLVEYPPRARLGEQAAAAATEQAVRALAAQLSGQASR